MNHDHASQSHLLPSSFSRLAFALVASMLVKLIGELQRLGVGVGGGLGLNN